MGSRLAGCGWKLKFEDSFASVQAGYVSGPSTKWEEKEEEDSLRQSRLGGVGKDVRVGRGREDICSSSRQERNCLSQSISPLSQPKDKSSEQGVCWMYK